MRRLSLITLNSKFSVDHPSVRSSQSGPRGRATVQLRHMDVNSVIAAAPRIQPSRSGDCELRILVIRGRRDCPEMARRLVAHVGSPLRSPEAPIRNSQFAMGGVGGRAQSTPPRSLHLNRPNPLAAKATTRQPCLPDRATDGSRETLTLSSRPSRRPKGGGEWRDPGGVP